jgi:hypothetical protein
MRALIALVVVACATAHPTIAPKPAIATVAPQSIRARIRLDVVDPTDLEGRLQTLLRRELATRGIETIATPERSGLIARVVVLNRQRIDQPVQTHESGTRPASGFGLVGGSDDPANAPEQHNGAQEPFDFGKTYTQSDLRMFASASLSRAGTPATLANWDDVEGTLARVGDGTNPRVRRWQAVYEAMAARLADQIAAGIAQQR